MTIMQGDAYSIPCSIENNGTVVTSSMVNKVEICIGTLRKYYPDTVSYNSTFKTFDCPLTQQETFNMCGQVPVQIRCYFATGDVKGCHLGDITVVKSVSKRVL